MQRIKDVDHLAIFSDASYPVGPDTSGEITYVHVPPLGPLSIITIALGCMAVAAFIWCYVYPMVRKWHGDSTAKDDTKRPILASVRALFGLRPRQSPPTPPPPPTPELLARYGRSDLSIARPPPAAMSRSRGSLDSPSLSSSSSSSPPTPTETPMKYASPSRLPEVIVAPVDVGILGQTVGSRTTPKKGGDRCDGHKEEDG